MDIVERVKERIERKRSREKPNRKREREVWELENWLIGTGRTIGKKTRKPRL